MPGCQKFGQIYQKFRLESAESSRIPSKNPLTDHNRTVHTDLPELRRWQRIKWKFPEYTNEGRRENSQNENSCYGPHSGVFCAPGKRSNEFYFWLRIRVFSCACYRLKSFRNHPFRIAGSTGLAIAQFRPFSLIYSRSPSQAD